MLTSTAIVMQMLEERGETSTPKGQRIVSILLLEDLAIVPLLALVAFLAPGGAGRDAGGRAGSTIGIGARRRSRRWSSPGAGCSIRCSASSPTRGRAR